MRIRFLLLSVIIVILVFSYPTFAREKSGQFGFGLYNIGYFFPLLDKNVEFKEGEYDVNTNFEAESDFIHDIQFTYRVTNRTFFQLAAGYYEGLMKVNTEYYRATEERKEWVSLDGKNDYRIIPISLGLGASFLKEGNFDPYASLGFTFYRVKVDQIELSVNNVEVRDSATNARISSAEKDLRNDFLENYISRDYATELGYYANLGMNYFFMENFAVNSEFRYYGGRAGLYNQIQDVGFNIGGFALTFGLKFVF
jgi:opacity protein-like surface antigen